MTSISKEEKEDIEVKDAPEEKPETLAESSTEKTGEEKEEKVEEPKIPLSRLRQERDKRKKLQTELSAKETKPPSEGRTDDEKTRLRETLKEIETERTTEEKKAEQEFDEEVEDYTVIDPTFTKTRATNLVDKYGVNVEGAWKLHQDFTGKPETAKPKSPNAPRTTDNIKAETISEEDIKKLSLEDIVQRAKDKAGL